MYIHIHICVCMDVYACVQLKHVYKPHKLTTLSCPWPELSAEQSINFLNTL